MLSFPPRLAGPLVSVNAKDLISQIIQKEKRLWLKRATD